MLEEDSEWQMPPLLCTMPSNRLLSLEEPGVESIQTFFLFLLSLSLAIQQFWLLSRLGSLRLPSGHSGPVLTLSNAARSSLSLPRLLEGDTSVWAAALLGAAVRHVICGFSLFLYLFFLPVILPSEIPSLPTDPPVRGFPGVWKLLF